MKGSRHIRTAVAAVLFSTALGAADCRAQAAWFGKNKVQYKNFDWQVLTTPHFDIHFYEGYRDLALRTAVILEYGYEKIAQDFDHRIAWRIPAIVYGSHSDFQQTNVTWGLLPEGVQAFAEPTRKRMVVHYGGSNVDYVHTCIHELVHMFQFDIIYGSLLRSAFAQGALFRIPLWFAEGITEYYSLGGMDDGARMFMRDATVFDYLPHNLEYAGGYMVYKAGQSAIDYMIQMYGTGKVVEIMDQLRYRRSLDLALEATIGLTTEEFTEEWKKWLRRRHWPEYADKKEPEAYGRRLTDHYEQHHYANTKPQLSPDGEHIIFYSDRKGLDGIYLMDALSGKIKRKLLIGSLSERFEAIRTMKSSLTWAPDGRRIAFIAKSGGSDRLFILTVPRGRVEREIELPIDFLFSPAWSPDGGRIALLGSIRGQTDLFVFDLETGTLMQVTDDPEDEKDPAWFPDGRRIAYARYPRVAPQPFFEPDSAGTKRLAGVDLRERYNVLEANADIWSVDLVTGEKKPLIATRGNDASPQIIRGGEEILFTSDETGINNLYRGSIATGGYYRFTDVLGGLFTPSCSEQRNRLVFSAFNQAGFDLFIMDRFEEQSGAAYSTGGPLLDGPESERRPFGVIPDASSVTVEYERQVPDTAAAHPVELGMDAPETAEREERIDFVAVDEAAVGDVHPDTLEAIRRRMIARVGTIEHYSLKFSPDFIGNNMGLYFSTGLGFGLMNQVAVSDLLGDHHFFLQFSLYGALEDSDVMLSYYYLKRRIDYSLGVFQFKNYLNSRLTSVGEIFTDYRFFTERNYGLYANASYPFSTFTRAELELQAFVSEREFYATEAVVGSPEEIFFLTTEYTQRRLFQPSLSFVHDSAYYGYFGPVIGSRWMISASRAVSFSGRDISRTSAFLDYRRYFPLWHRNSFALRAVTSMSTGPDRRYYFLGGPRTLRGYDYLQFQGPRMMLLNFEYRYPLVDVILFGWPGRWALTNIGGTLFLDTGSVWGEPRYVESLDPRLQARKINDLEFYSNFGLGFFMRFGYLILDFQFGWPTDYSYTGKPVFHFYIGPQF